MENQAAESSLASRVTKLKLRVTFRRGEARGKRERVQNHDQVYNIIFTCLLGVITITALRVELLL